MSAQEIVRKIPFSSVQMISAATVIAGLILTTWNWGFFVFTGLGAFGPGLLRELGWLKDKDEFQVQSDRRAGYFSYLITGILSVITISYIRSTGQIIERPEDLVLFLFVSLWFTWTFCTLLSYWGPKITAVRMLSFFGVAWLLFAMITNAGEEWKGWQSFLLSTLLCLPFLISVLFLRRYPRIIGFLLVVISVMAITYFFSRFTSNLSFITVLVSVSLYVTPLLCCGVVLSTLPSGSSDEGADEDEIS